METQDKYIPGVCNIGLAEIKKRKRAGFIGLALTALLWAACLLLGSPRISRLVLFFPAMMAATGFIQAQMHFCAGFGFRSLFNFGDVGKTDTVMQAEFRAMDRKKAWQIIIYSALVALAVAIVAYVF